MSDKGGGYMREQGCQGKGCGYVRDQGCQG